MSSAKGKIYARVSLLPLHTWAEGGSPRPLLPEIRGVSRRPEDMRLGTGDEAGYRRQDEHIVSSCSAAATSHIYSRSSNHIHGI